MKQYKLLKDLPDLKAGAIFGWDKDFKKYASNMGNDDYYTYDTDYIESQPEWFEEVIQEKTYTLTEEQINKLIYLAKTRVYDEDWQVLDLFLFQTDLKPNES